MLNYSNLPDKELFKLLADKDIKAAKFIYDKYSPAIYGMILRKIKFQKVAERILIDTFVSFISGDFGKAPLHNTVFTRLHAVARSHIKKSDVLIVSSSSAETIDQKYFSKYRGG